MMVKLISQLDKIYKRDKRGKYTYWAWGIVLGIVGVVLASMHQYGISCIIFGISVYFFFLIYRIQDIEGNICQIASVLPSQMIEKKEVFRPLRKECAPVILPITEYLDEKPNPHVLFTGMSGIRKTTTMDYILHKIKKPKIIFNFKPNDMHLNSGWKVIDISVNAPDPFADIGAFNSAFATAYHIVPERRGYMATQISSVLNEALQHSKKFDELIRFLEKDANKRSGDVAFGVLTQIKPLVIRSKTLTSLDLSQDVVLDFSSFEFDEAKVFYAELVLNQIWNILKKQRQEMVIVIDEAHHLLAVPTTKINEFLKEGRSLGVAVYAATQAYTDIDSGIRSNFATKLIFKTDDDEALNQLKAIPQTNLGEVAHFATGEFTDVGFPKLKEFVPIFYLVQDKHDCKNIMAEEKKIEEEEREEPIVTEDTRIEVDGDATSQDREVSLRDKILELLGNEAMYSSEIAKAFYENESTREEKNKVKLAINNELNKLVSEGILDKCKYVNHKWTPSKKANVYYYKKDKNLSNLHRLLQNETVGVLKSADITILNEATGQGIQGEDIELEKCVIECETGLKESLGEFDKKMMEHVKAVIIVVPNHEQKERYSYLSSVQNGKAKVVLLPELLKELESR